MIEKANNTTHSPSIGSQIFKYTSTLKFRVVLAAVISSLITGLLSTAYVTHQTQQETMAQLVRQQADNVEVIAGVLSSKIDQIQRILQLIGQGITPQTIQSTEQIQAFLAADSTAQRYFSRIQIAQLDGTLVANQALAKALPLQALTDTERRLIEQTVVSRTGLVSQPISNAGESLSSILFTWPLVGADGKTFGAVSGGVKLYGQGLLPRSLDLAGSFESTLVVYDRSGIVLFHSDPEHQLQHVNSLPGLAQMHQEWLNEGGDVMTESRTYTDNNYIVSAAGMLTPQWLVARITPKQAALAPMQAVQRWSWLITGSITALCAAVAAALIMWMTHPIALLRKRSALIHADTISPHAGWPKAGGELGELTAALRAAAIERSQLPAQQAMVEQLRAILNFAPVGIFMARDSRLELVGQQACSMLGYEADELIGKHTASIFGSKEAFSKLQAAMAQQLQENGFFDTEMLLHRKDGSDFWAHVVARSINIDSHEFSHIWIFEDITLARKAQEALAWKAAHDPLTHLVNRREFEGRLHRALQTTGALPNYKHILMFIDLDYFKAINDGAGHAAGDNVLLQVAQILQSHTGEKDTVCRMGGDEFAVLLMGEAALQPTALAEKMRAAIEAIPIHHEGQTYPLGASIGIVWLDESFTSTPSALSAADAACYAAKRTGRNCVVEYSPHSS